MRGAQRGLGLIEALAAAVVLAVVLAATLALSMRQTEQLRRARDRADAVAWADAIGGQLERAFAAASPAATVIDWHFEGVAARLSLPASGEVDLPTQPVGLAPTAPRWRVFPLGQPRAEDGAGPGSYGEGGGRWVAGHPTSGGVEGAPGTPGWDANSNGVRDRPDKLLAPLSAGEVARGLVYRIAIAAPSSTGAPYPVTLRIYQQALEQRAREGAKGIAEQVAGALLLTRSLELRPGEGR